MYLLIFCLVSYNAMLPGRFNDVKRKKYLKKYFLGGQGSMGPSWIIRKHGLMVFHCTSAVELGHIRKCSPKLGFYFVECHLVNTPHVSSSNGHEKVDICLYLRYFFILHIIKHIILILHIIFVMFVIFQCQLYPDICED